MLGRLDAGLSLDPELVGQDSGDIEGPVQHESDLDPVGHHPVEVEESIEPGRDREDLQLTEAGILRPGDGPPGESAPAGRVTTCVRMAFKGAFFERNRTVHGHYELFENSLEFEKNFSYYSLSIETRLPPLVAGSSGSVRHTGGGRAWPEIRTVGRQVK